MLNRRQMIKRAAVGAGALAVAGPLILIETGCGPKVNFYVATIEGALAELKPLLPNATGLIDKALTVARDFGKAYARGDFTNALTIFQTLSDDLAVLAADAGVNNPTVKIVIATAGVALRAIAVLLAGQAQAPAVKAGAARATTAQATAADTVRSLANPAAITQVFKTVMH